MQRRVLFTTLPWILNIVVRLVKFRNAPLNTLHFISNNGFFFRFLFCGKEATTTTKQTWKGKTISVDYFLI